MFSASQFQSPVLVCWYTVSGFVLSNHAGVYPSEKIKCEELSIEDSLPKIRIFNKSLGTGRCYLISFVTNTH